MSPRRALTLLSALTGACLLAGLLVATPASAHGSMQDPVSRIYACYLQGPESPDTDACRALLAAGGTQPLYDWPEVNQANAAGRHREIIPDGQLCSAGRDKYRGLDLPRADWPATELPTSGTYTFTFLPTVKHRGSFELYVTRDGYDPTQPLTWADLEPTPFARITDPNAYSVTAPIPAGKTGRHLIYVIWQRNDSPEAFYSCSDVVFGEEPPPPDPECPQEWHPVVTYLEDDQATHDGHAWEARFWTRGDEPGTGNPQWGPWQDLGPCPAATTATRAAPGAFDKVVS